MRNLKKVLALVLAMAMSLSLAVTAGAAFKDESEFSAEYVTAAEALTNLGVLWGYEDGSFNPQGDITRAETAALIYRMTTGDVTDANKGNYTNMTNGFDDVKNTDWFAGYVNFCANAEYVAGYGDGKFGPQDKVTGYQTLAMILRAVGFDKPDEFTGADWEVKTASFAQKLGILDNVKGSEKLGEPASRELVAELLFQAMATVDLVHYAPFFGYVDVVGV
ncbi:MAG: S-layer homology domain-containing protein, partial [Ruminiclostridium sp.]|nr:S-layer homology domain-containing protein [Ruminiclostridium sp.]